MKLKIKDKIFKLKDMKPIEVNYFIQETEAKKINNIIELESSIRNFKKAYKIVKDKELFKNYYNQLIMEKRKKENNLFTNYEFLYEFQKQSIKKILNTNYRGFILSLQQGLGKTVVSLITAKIRKENNIWIVAPASLLNQWKDEIIKWLGNNDICIYNGTKTQRDKLYKKINKYNIISYETLRNDYMKNLDLKKNIINSFMIFDESTKLKNKKTKLYKSFLKICKMNKFNLFLTGTPINNALQDIDNVIKLIDKKITNINNHLVWEEVRIGWGHNAKIFHKVVGYKNLDDYLKNISNIYFREIKNNVAKELPKKNIITINIKQTKLQHKIKEAILNNMSAFQGFTLLQTLECGYEIIKKSNSENAQLIIDEFKFPINNENPKLEVLYNLLEEVNDSVLIFSRFKESCNNIAESLKKKFPNKKITIVTAETKNKNEIATKFKNKEIDYVIATDTWAKGISFPDIDYLINFDISASFEMYFQKQDRIHRINSITPKFIYNLVGDVIENHIMDLLKEKTKLAEQITEGKGDAINKIDIKKEIIKKLGWY